jgi:Holliday junction resolvase RusA-like endonuclease
VSQGRSTSSSATRGQWTALAAARQPEFALEAPQAAPAPELDVRRVVGQEIVHSSRRVLLDAVPLPMPPSINAYWRSRAIKQKDTERLMAIVYTTDEAKAYQEALKGRMLELKAWYRTEQPLAMKVLLCFKDERPHDIDNRIKPLLDALAHANVIMNDKQVKQLEVRQGPNLNPMVCYVTLTEFLPDRIANRGWIIAAPGDDHAR